MANPRIPATVASAVIATLVVLPTSPANAAQSCRSVARGVSSVVVTSTNIDQAKQAFSDAIQAHPDCQAELVTLSNWYASGGKSPYPFKAEDDPAKPFLGPVGWWWNTVYVSWFHRSLGLMIFFGWEIFLAPIIFLGTIALAMLSGLGSLFVRGAKPGPA